MRIYTTAMMVGFLVLPWANKENHRSTMKYSWCLHPNGCGHSCNRAEVRFLGTSEDHKSELHPLFVCILSHETIVIGDSLMLKLFLITMKQRIAYIDRMKGFTILLVVIGHLYLFGVHISDCIPNRFIAACHMHLFMFLSGYVAYISQDVAHNGGKSLERKVLQRILSYIVPCFTITWIIGLYIYFVSDKPYNYLLHLSEYGGYWYLKSLTLYSIILYTITKINKMYINVCILIASYILFYIGWRKFPLMNDILCLEHAVSFSPFFFMGYFFRKYNLLPKIMNNNWIFSLSFIGFVVLFFVELPIHGLQVISRQFVRPTFAILFISYLFGQRTDKNSYIENWLEWLGTKTLDIYLYHGFFLAGIGFGVLNLDNLSIWVQDTNNSLFCLLVIIITSVFLSYFSIWIGYILKNSKILRKFIYGQINLI